MRALWMAGLLLLAGCSLTIDPDGVPAPQACVSTGCSTVTCGQLDNCGNTCTTGCIAPTVQGGGLGGSAAASGSSGSFRLQGGLVSGAGSASGTNHRIEQGTLR